MIERRVNRDNRRTFAALVGVSVVLHLVLTPFAGMLGFLQAWLERPTAAELEPTEQLKEIPIELFDAPEEEVEPPKAELPQEDPVAFIEQLDGLPVRPEPTVPLPTPKPPKPKTDDTEKDKDRDKKEAEKDKTEKPQALADAGAPAASTAEKSSAAPAPSETEPVVEPPPAVASSGPSAPPTPVASDGVSPTKPEVPIDNPIALAGKAAKLVEKNTSVGLILYMDRIRGHALGKRVGEILPSLPQWNDFFGASTVNPVRDFERMFLLGPSFVDSSGLVMAIDHRVSQDKMRAAVNELVKKRGQWLTGTKFPVAVTYADRAERVVLLSSPTSVMVVPPHLQEQAVKQGETHIPKAKGEEAVVASVSNPSKALRRFGLEVPASLQLAKLRVTPLSQGGVLLELDAQDESEAAARQTAVALTRSINATLDMISGVSDLLGRFGFGGLAAGADLPRVTLRSGGKWVRASQVLSEAQVKFILDRLERQLVRPRAEPVRAPSPVLNPAPARTSNPASTSAPSKPAASR